MLFRSARPAAASQISESELVGLPLNGRSFDTLITLNPGTVNYSAYKAGVTGPSSVVQVSNTQSPGTFSSGHCIGMHWM